MGLALRLGIADFPAFFKAAGVALGITLATLPTTPTARWHPGFSTVVESGGRVVSATDLQGLAGLTEGSAGIGPYSLADGTGRKFWRFEGAEFLNVATTLASVGCRALSVFFVGRMHNVSAVPGNNIFSLGNALAGTAVTLGTAQMAATSVTQAAPFLRSTSIIGSSDVTNAKWLIPGSQLQVMSVNGRTTALGGTRMMINGKASSGLAQPGVATVVNGAEIGRYAFAPGASGAWGYFDLYEMVVYSASLTNAEQDAIQAALQANYGISEINNQIVLEGDSITQGTGTTKSGTSSGMRLSEPGLGRIPATWRVVNMGTSGNQVSNLTTKRDATNSWASFLLPGQNVVAVEIGRNDIPAIPVTAAQHYANVVPYLNTTTTGVLQRGWTVRYISNISTGNAGIQAEMVAFRALIRNAQFLTDTGTNSGGAFDGKLSIINTDLIQKSGATIFEDAADALNATYFQGDSTHPSTLGADYRVSGADTPQYGIGYGLT